MSKTPRTDAATIRIETPGFSGDIVFPGSAKHLETDLNAAHAQISALREALKNARHGLFNCLSPLNTTAYLNEIDRALSTPPPPVVPLEDVRPLVEAISAMIIGVANLSGALDSCRDGPTSSQVLRYDHCGMANAALATFTAKHPLT